MHLKRIELAGFKSFAKRIELDFRPGVTLSSDRTGAGNPIYPTRSVGARRTIRQVPTGAKMEDVIFAGSEGENHRNVAEVTLVLDNRDERLRLPYEEVSVTRRVTRSGDSDYFMNKKPCRLKRRPRFIYGHGLSRTRLPSSVRTCRASHLRETGRPPSRHRGSGGCIKISSTKKTSRTETPRYGVEFVTRRRHLVRTCRPGRAVA